MFSDHTSTVEAALHNYRSIIHVIALLAVGFFWRDIHLICDPEYHIRNLFIFLVIRLVSLCFTPFASEDLDFFDSFVATELCLVLCLLECKLPYR